MPRCSPRAHREALVGFGVLVAVPAVLYGMVWTFGGRAPEKAQPVGLTASAPVDGDPCDLLLALNDALAARDRGDVVTLPSAPIRPELRAAYAEACRPR